MLQDRLPQVLGTYTPDFSLGPSLWFRVGGAAEVLFKPKDHHDLSHFLKNRPQDIPVTILGVGSNVLVRDGGIPGVVIKLTRGFREISQQENSLICGAGALDRTVALTAASLGLGGLEFLVGIPGTVGGAVFMNAGAYGTEIKDVLESAVVLMPDGETRVFESQELGFSYRGSALPEGSVVVQATLRCAPCAPQDSHFKMDEIMRNREAAQPVNSRTGGSTFKNPAEGRKAWELIDAAGLRGQTCGGALVSPKHCNFLINTGTASAEDLEELGEEVRETVYKKTGILLEWEIKRLGVKLEKCHD